VTILALDTTTSSGSVALLRDGTVLLDETFAADRSQSSQLFPILQRALGVANRLEMIAVGLGPGSYAGARIAIAAALGLACATGAELLGLPTVAALETNLDEYVAIGDARRDTFYFTRVNRGICTEGPLLLDLQALRERLNSIPSLPVLSPAPITPVPRATVALPSAKNLAALASSGRSIAQRGDLEPLYLRDPHITTPKARLPVREPR
jgi:tRNA threonylcarbamoyladenosine biosynthesis protein TsaB